MSDSKSSPSTIPNGSVTSDIQDNGKVQAITNHYRPLSPPLRKGDNLLLYLIAYRILNALLVQTFFQPDEYFQSLEPALKLAFGEESSTWITWEWRSRLRSAIHPSIFAGAYQIAHSVSTLFSLNAPVRAELLLTAPGLVQAFIAAIGDYYTWKLALYIYEARSNTAWAALVLSVVSPWQWFCATRTFSNCLETTLTIIALYNWPWHWFCPGGDAAHHAKNSSGLRRRNATGSQRTVDEVTRLRRSLLCAALATILRPTNVLIWGILVLSTVLRGNKSRLTSGKTTVANSNSGPWFVLPTRSESYVFVREAAYCGATILLLSALVDRTFYQTWTFPPYNFLRVNVLQGLAVFYGNNNWHYYFSQGYPLLLTTALPFTVVGLYNSVLNPVRLPNVSTISRSILYDLSVVAIFVPVILSAISHKEVRFIYPLLPPLHLIAAAPLISFFAPAFRTLTMVSGVKRRSRQFVLLICLLLNITIGFYTTRIHNSGLLQITHYLRHEFESYYSDSYPEAQRRSGEKFTNMTVGFLMPCHSTPWRSHLQNSPTELGTGIDAWALTCEPPLDLSSAEKANYLDEADQFYADPSVWLQKHMSRHLPSTILAQQQRSQPQNIVSIESGFEKNQWRVGTGRRPWPEYLIFFEQLEQVMTSTLQGSGYIQCTRIFNSHFHDDWRRTGDIVVWCLHPDRANSNKPNLPTRKLESSVWERLKSFIPDTSAPSMEEIEDSLHNPSHDSPRERHANGNGKQRVLGTRNGKKPSESPLSKVGVEKSFWKQRPKEEEKKPDSPTAVLLKRLKTMAGLSGDVAGAAAGAGRKKNAKKKMKKETLWS